MMLPAVLSVFLLALPTAAPAGTDATRAARSAPAANAASIAVVSGSKDSVTVAAAEFLAQALERHSRMRVLSPKRVAQLLPGYPSAVRGPFRERYFEVNDDCSHSDFAALRRIKERLGTDYLYVVWLADAWHVQGELTYTFAVQLLEGPAGTLVHTSSFHSEVWGGIDCCLRFQRPSLERQMRRLERESENNALDLIDAIDARKFTVCEPPTPSERNAAE